MLLVVSIMEPRRIFDLGDLDGLEFGGGVPSSDSGCSSDVLVLEDMFPWSDHGDSYTEGSDLPRSPVLSEFGEDNPRSVSPGLWPAVEEEDDYPPFPASASSDDEELPDLSASMYLPESFGAEEEGVAVPGPSHHQASFISCRELPAGAETDSEEDEFGLCYETPAGSAGCLPDDMFSVTAEVDSEEEDSSHELPWYQRSVYWESWYEDLMHDLGEDY